jgi:hypothetical protein
MTRRPTQEEAVVHESAAGPSRGEGVYFSSFSIQNKDKFDFFQLHFWAEGLGVNAQQ